MNWTFTYNQNEVAKETNIVQQLLAKKGLTEPNEIKSFLNPTEAQLQDPQLLEGLIIAKKRIDQAIAKGESILVFGDYDADGVTSTTLLVETLHELGAMCDYYIPNRFTEGYGPNPNAFREAKRQGFDLVITVDTGIAAFEAAEVAKELELDLIITDHHEIQGQLPVALAIIHPHCSDDYPFKSLAGVGVAFKLAQYLLGYFPKQFLDLVVIGTIADLVPLEGENRVLAKLGLDYINQSSRAGIIALKEVAGIKGRIDEQDIGFGISPRLNAVGRLQTAYPAVELLLTDDKAEAQRIATEIDLINQERQEIVKQIVEEATALVEQDPEANKHVIVLAKEGWNEGVLGIVASKLVRTFQRPAICLTLKSEQGKAKGSGRSITAFDLFENGMSIREKFLQFGGHAQAAGMTVAIDKIAELRIAFNQLAGNQLAPEDYQEQAQIDASIDLSLLSIVMIQEIEQLAPFGMANPRPLFHIKAEPTEARQIGANKNHLKLTLTQESHQLATVGFGLGSLQHKMTTGTTIEAIGHLQVNEWNGSRSPQLLVQDLRVQERQVFDFRGSKLWKQELTSVDKATVFVYFHQGSYSLHPNAIYFEQLLTANKIEVTELVILDLPNQLADLSEVLKLTQPDNIYTCFQTDHSHFLTGLPNRDDFKWFYGLVLQRGKYDHNQEQHLIIKNKQWKKNKIEFIIKVFSELEFVKIANGVVRPNPDVEKKPLTDSHSYQLAIARSEAEEVLYYSNYQQLKRWLKSQIESEHSMKEEVINGL